MVINSENGVNKHRTYRTGRKHQESKMRHLQYLSRIAQDSKDDSQLKDCNPGSDPGSKRRDSTTNHEDVAISQRPVKQYKGAVPVSPESTTTLEDVAISQRPAKQCKDQVPESQESPRNLEDTTISQRPVIQFKDPVPASSRSPTNSEDAAMSQRPLSWWWDPGPVLPYQAMNSDHATIREQLAKQWKNPVRLYSPRNSEDEATCQLPAWTWCEPGCMSPYPPINPEHAVISQHIVVQDPGPEAPAPPTMVVNSENWVRKRRTRRGGRKNKLRKLKRLQYLHGIGKDSADDSLPKGCNPDSDSGADIHDAPANHEDTAISQQLAMQWKDPNPESPVPPTNPENAAICQRPVVQCKLPVPGSPHSPTYPYHEEAGIHHRFVLQYKDPVPYSLHSPANPDDVAISEQSVLQDTKPVPQLPNSPLNSEGVAMNRRSVMQCMDPIPDSPASPTNPEDAGIYQRPVMQCVGQVTESEGEGLRRRSPMQWKEPRPDLPESRTNTEVVAVRRQPAAIRPPPVQYGCEPSCGGMYRMHPVNEAICREIRMCYIDKPLGPAVPLTTNTRPRDDATKRKIKAARDRRKHLYKTAKDSANDSRRKGCNPDSDPGSVTHNSTTNHEDTVISQQSAMHHDKDPVPSLHELPMDVKVTEISQQPAMHDDKYPVPPLHELPGPGLESTDPPTMPICSEEGVEKRRTHTETHSAGRDIRYKSMDPCKSNEAKFE